MNLPAPPVATIEAYLDAIAQRDVARCVACFASRATVHFMMQTYTGPERIRLWHEERFANGLEATAANGAHVTGDEATIELVVRSNRLRIWRIHQIRARGHFRFDDNGRIVEARFNLARPDFVTADTAGQDS